MPWKLSMLRTCQPCDGQPPGPAQVRELLAKGANTEAVDKDGLTALYLAALNGHEAATCSLCKGGAAICVPALVAILKQDWPQMEDTLATCVTTKVPPDELGGRATALMPASAPRTIVRVSNSDKLEFKTYNFQNDREGEKLLPQTKRGLDGACCEDGIVRFWDLHGHPLWGLSWKS